MTSRPPPSQERPFPAPRAERFGKPSGPPPTTTCTLSLESRPRARVKSRKNHPTPVAGNRPAGCGTAMRTALNGPGNPRHRRETSSPPGGLPRGTTRGRKKSLTPSKQQNSRKNAVAGLTKVSAPAPGMSSGGRMGRFSREKLVVLAISAGQLAGPTEEPEESLQLFKPLRPIPLSSGPWPLPKPASSGRVQHTTAFQQSHLARG